MHYLRVEPDDIPMSLLLEADPSPQNIATYLQDAWCFAVTLHGAVIGACVVKALDEITAEIFNVSVAAPFQQQGIGSELLRFALHELKNSNVQRVELGTGTFGYQLTYYQRLGFRVDSVLKDHFLKHYPEPIFEQGIQHQDMLRLSLDLN
ncbi:GNAT family N-acetyltransferase [Vibrio fluvialis]|uniref:GNAT family N-acetyltransferase n=1 Tax=Vibrio fluvialis TaxID=676 RepID=UPI001F171923|nr:GNAT family N-acetyltransferase [Vibrio fluvialis]MCE7660032.1 GNAT family N-acetyltransferase [Vibrio fluvialis]